MLIIAAIGGFFLPISAFAATPFVVAGWIPFWKKASGTPEAMAHFPQLSEVSPFSYEMEDDGTLGDTMKLATSPWTEMMASATAKKAKVIPTVAWFHGSAILAVLSATSSRRAHVSDLVGMTVRNNFDGVDIDYEGKLIGTKYYFSRFIKELSTALHEKKKMLVCTIEARTPPSSLFKVPPAHIEHVNDFVVLNKYCDEVRVMTYDQTDIDLHLNKAKGDFQLYAPVADTEWVKKVMQLTTQTIAPKKLMLGIPSYGYEYIVNPDNVDNPYDKIRAISHADALALAASYDIVPARNNAGERSFNYKKNGVLHYVSWSDAGAIGAKVKLAKQLGLRGVAVFKIDGGADPLMWSVLK